MKLNDILKALHSNNDNSIVNVINSSTYCDNYRETKSSNIIHTGFTYSNHNNKEFDLLYDLTNHKLINQVRIPGYCLPLICGMIYLLKSPNEKYYGRFNKILIFKYNELNEGFAFVEIKEPHSYMNKTNIIESVGVIYQNEDKNYIVNGFTIADRDNNEITYPLNKIYTRKLHFNGEYYSLTPFTYDDYENLHDEDDDY